MRRRFNALPYIVAAESPSAHRCKSSRGGFLATANALRGTHTMGGERASGKHGLVTGFSVVLEMTSAGLFMENVKVCGPSSAAVPWDGAAERPLVWFGSQSGRHVGLSCARPPQMEKQRTSEPYPSIFRRVLRQGIRGYEAGLWPWGLTLGLTKGTVLGAALVRAAGRPHAWPWARRLVLDASVRFCPARAPGTACVRPPTEGDVSPAPRPVTASTRRPSHSPSSAGSAARSRRPRSPAASPPGLCRACS